ASSPVSTVQPKALALGFSFCTSNRARVLDKAAAVPSPRDSRFTSHLSQHLRAGLITCRPAGWFQLLRLMHVKDDPTIRGQRGRSVVRDGKDHMRDAI